MLASVETDRSDWNGLCCLYWRGDTDSRLPHVTVAVPAWCTRRLAVGRRGVQAMFRLTGLQGETRLDAASR